MTIVGARPQFVKLKPLSDQIKNHFTEIIVHTGQHYDEQMSEIFFSELNIPTPDYNLNVRSGSPGYQLAEMLKGIETVIIKESPDLIIVFGDTNSTLAGGICAVQNHIPFAHIEAGPRNKYIDVPEMLNRLIVDNISPLLFCATKKNYNTLVSEGLKENAYFVGDLMYDIFLQNLEKINNQKHILNHIGVSKNNYHVATCHRAENTDSKKRLETIIKGLIESNETIVFSIHPRTKKMIEKYNLMKLIDHCDNLIKIDPVVE